MRKVHILTFHNALNYGAVLQCVALYKTVSLFAACDIIDYHSPQIEDAYKIFSKKRSIKKNIRGLLLKSRTVKKRKSFGSFLNENVQLTKKYSNIDDLKKEIWEVDDIFCVGSDQVWNFDLTNMDDAFFFSFIPNQYKKISYAASLGKNLIVEEIPCFEHYLESFDAVSVREKSAQEDLEKNNIECVQNIDPVYLLKKSDWEKLTVQVKEEKESYILVYLLQKSKNFMDKILEFAKKYNKRVLVITAIGIKKIAGVTYLETCSPQEFIRYFLKADVVFTNSFHGISLSIIFNKIFYFEYLEGKYKTNSRLKDTISFFELEKLNSNYYEEIPAEMKIDYSVINKKIKTEQKRSIDYLKHEILNDQMNGE